MIGDGTGTDEWLLEGIVRGALNRAGAVGWTVELGDFWCVVRPGGQVLRESGWKLHVSSTVLAGPVVLARAAEVLVSEGCAFKFARDLNCLGYLLSNQCARDSGGKFLTVYPRDDEQFRRLAAELDRVTDGLPGPAVLSDRPVRAGSVVHYRYGSFSGNSVLSNDGDFRPIITSPDGQKVTDERQAWFSPPQWAATTWFDLSVDHMGDGGNRYCALLLTGTLQVSDGLPVYSLASTGDAQFYLANDVVRKIEITSAVMSTRSLGDRQAKEPEDRLAKSWLGLSGFLDFEIIRAPDRDDPDESFPLDLFSFGSGPGEDEPRTGLAFANLGILMTFPPDAPQDREFAFEAGEMAFDVATSTAREGSLFRQFALDVGGIVSGGLTMPPIRSGYLPVVTDARLTGVERGPWWGIDYMLTMGSAGHLAGQAGLTGHVLTAWSTRRTRDRRLGGVSEEAASYAAGVGLKLPGTGGGAKLISLQSVLRLSIGQIWLRYDPGEGAFLLLLSEIALRVLGLGKLPPGSTLFYLFGDKDSAGAPSGLGWYAKYLREGIGQ